MSIQRYEPEITYYPYEGTPSVVMEPLENGDYVLYEDHAAEVARLTGERDELADMDRTQCPNCNNCIRDLREDKARLLAERDAAVALAAKMEADAAHFCAGLCVHPKGVIGDDGGSACCPITGTRDAIAAAQDANPRALEPSLIPVYPGPELKRGDIVYTPKGNRAEVYSITADEGVHTSRGWFCASVLRREAQDAKPADPYSGQLGDINLRMLAKKMHMVLRFLKRQGVYHAAMNTIIEEGHMHGLGLAEPDTSALFRLQGGPEGEDA